MQIIMYFYSSFSKYAHGLESEIKDGLEWQYTRIAFLWILGPHCLYFVSRYIEDKFYFQEYIPLYFDILFANM